VLEVATRNVIRMPITFFYDRRDAEGNRGGHVVSDCCLSNDVLFVWIDSEVDGVVWMARMGLSSPCVEWMQDGNLEMLGYYVPLDQIITCQRRGEKCLWLELMLKQENVSNYSI